MLESNKQGRDQCSRILRGNCDEEKEEKEEDKTFRKTPKHMEKNFDNEHMIECIRLERIFGEDADGMLVRIRRWFMFEKLYLFGKMRFQDF